MTNWLAVAALIAVAGFGFSGGWSYHREMSYGRAPEIPLWGGVLLSQAVVALGVAALIYLASSFGT